MSRDGGRVSHTKTSQANSVCGSGPALRRGKSGRGDYYCLSKDAHFRSGSGGEGSLPLRASTLFAQLSRSPSSPLRAHSRAKLEGDDSDSMWPCVIPSNRPWIWKIWREAFIHRQEIISRSLARGSSLSCSRERERELVFVCTRPQSPELHESSTHYA